MIVDLPDTTVSKISRALIDVPGMDAEQIGVKAMNIAADCCTYTNHNFVKETIHLDANGEAVKKE